MQNVGKQLHASQQNKEHERNPFKTKILPRGPTAIQLHSLPTMQGLPEASNVAENIGNRRCDNDVPNCNVGEKT